MRLAGAVSPTVAERLAATLGVDGERTRAEDDPVPPASSAERAE